MHHMVYYVPGKKTNEETTLSGRMQYLKALPELMLSRNVEGQLEEVQIVFLCVAIKWVPKRKKDCQKVY